MKVTSVLLAILVVTFNLPLLATAQEFPSFCGMPAADPPPVSISPAVNYGGRYVTSTGTLRVLMVWIRFADDNEPSTTWPDPNALPDWGHTLSMQRTVPRAIITRVR
jgi:hypothetical protein